MTLPHQEEKFRITEAGLEGNEGTTIRDFTEVIYCEESPNYTESFGFQWNKFNKTQVDRFQSGLTQSKDRFFAVTRWDKEDLSGKKILEVGSGAGRFTSILLQHSQGEVFTVDYSEAVRSNLDNNGPHQRLRVFKASIYQLPFQPGQFDKVFCFGVLQHTPDVRQSVASLAAMVRPGGELIVDFYPVRGWYTRFHAKYLLRPFTRRMNHERLLARIDKNADRLIRWYRRLTSLGAGRLTRFLPVCDIDRTIPPGLDEKVLREWVVLDTFDMFSPAYDSPQRMETVVKWFEELGLTNVRGEVITYGAGQQVSVVRGRRK